MAGQDVQGMLIRIEATTAQLRQEMARADSSVTQVTGRIDRQLAQVDSAFDRLGLSAQRVGGVLKGALAIGIGGAGIGALISQAEAYTQIANRLKLVTSSSAEFTVAQNAVFSIAQKSGQPLTATAELYQRIAQNQDALKLSGKGVAGIVETISKTMVISGASAESSKAALIQLGQAFASGTLRGEELNSVMEQAPALSQAIAKGMGVSVGALRALGAEGKLTAESVVQALQAQQGAVDALFGKMQDTIGTGLTRVQSSFTKLIGEGDKLDGMSGRISAALTSASRAMDAITADGEGFAETVKNLGSALENVAYVGAAALTLGAGKLAVSFAQATLASIQQAGALALTTKASLEALTAEAALARQSLLTAQTRQLEAKALVERASLELAAAEGKVASDRVRQASEIGNIRLVQATLTAERELEGQRLKAQITDQGRTLSLGRIAELRVAEAGTIKLVQAAEVSLAATTIATSAEITAALGAEAAARGALAETTATTNAAKVASDRAAAAAAVGARASMALTTAGGGLLALLSGPVGLIAMTGLIAASFIDFGDGADTATAALIDQNSTIDESIKKYNELGAAQRRYQSITWAEEQIKATESAALALNKYSADGAEAFLQIGYNANEYRAKFKEMIEEVRRGQRTLDSVTEWAKNDAGLTDDKIKKLSESSSAYEETSKKAESLGKILGVVSGATAAVTSSTEKLKVAQKDSGQTDASKAAWDKYVEQLTKTRDLLGANAAAEAAYTAAKMGATPAQAAQAKLIADQTDTLKKYQDAIKEGDKVQQASLKLQLVALYTAEDAATQAAATLSKSYADTATAAENSARRQITAVEQAANFAVASATRVALGAAAPQTNLSGYGLLTNGGTAPAAPVIPKATPLERATASIAQLDATTEANKRVDKAANAAATSIKNQEKALTDLLAKSGISTKSANEMAGAYLSGADNIRAITIQQKIEEELLKTGAGARDAVTAAVNREADAKDRLDIDQSIASMRTETTNTLVQATATLQGADALETFNIQKSMSIALSGKKIDIGSKEYEQLLEQTKAQLAANKALEQASKAEGIVDRLNPQIKLLKDFTAEQEALNAAIASGVGDTAIYQDALVKLGNEYEVNRSKATLWGQMTEGAIDRIDEAFATAWGNIGSGAESLWDNLKKGFKQTLGEIAHMLTTKPLLASISNWLTGTDNGQGVGSVWSKLLGGGGGGGASDSNGWGGMVSLGKNLYSAWSNLTGVGSSIASGYASGGISGALSGGVGYYGNMLSSLGSTLSSGFSSIVSSITGTAAASTAATTGATSALGGALSGAVAEGAASIGTNIGIAGATTAAASNGIGAAISSAMSSAAAMWPLAIIMGMYQSGKLYSAGVRPDASEMWDSAGSTALGKAAMLPQTVGAKYFEITDNILGKVVGGKMAAILSGSTLFQAVWSKVGSKLFGSGYKTKDVGIELGVDGGVLDAQQYIKQKKKGGLISGKSKTRYLHNPLDAETQDALGSAYNEKILNSMGLFSTLGVKLSDSVLDALDVAATRISTKDKTPEAIQTELDAWFAKLGDSAVSAIATATGETSLAGYSFDSITQLVSNLVGVNNTFDTLNVKLLGMSVSSAHAVEQLLAMAGGLDAFNTAAASYYDKFFTETEKADDLLKAVSSQFSAVGVKLPELREGFRDLVEAIDPTTEAGRQMFVTLTGLAESASSAYDILEQRADAAKAAADAAKAASDAVNANYYGLFATEAEKANDKLADITAQFAAMGVVLPATKDDYRDMVYAASVAGESGKKMYDFLKSMASEATDAFAIAAQQAAALKATAIESATSAMEAMQRSINAQKTSINDMLSTANANVSGLTTVSNDLSEALKSLRGDSDDAVRMLRAQAQATLQSALATAKAGGSLAGFTGLSDALDTVSDNSTDLYSSLEDFNRDQGRTANVVAELNAINGKQLTSAEKTVEALESQLDRLDDQLVFAQAQLDAINGVGMSIMTVAAAVAAMNAAVVAALSTLPRSGAGSAVENTPTNNASIVDSIYKSVLGRDADAGGKAFWAAQLQSGGMTYDQIAKAIKDTAVANGELKGHATGGYISGPGTGTSDSIMARLSNGEYVMRAAAVSTYGTGLLDQMNSMQLPAFASGGGVGETAPQLHFTSPSRMFSSNQVGSTSSGDNSNASIVAELRAVRAELESIKANTQASAQSGGKLVRTLDRVTDGGNAMLTKELA